MARRWRHEARQGRLALLASIAIFALLPTGCASTSCGDDCGSGVAVWWEPGDLPPSASYELCVNGQCEPVEPVPFGGDGRLLGVAPATGIGDREVEVRLTVTVADDAVRTFEGSGTKVGDCCPGIELRVGQGDRLEVQHGSD